VVTLRGEDAPIGVVGFASIDRANAGAKVAWELSRAHWGRGLMSEAAARVVAHGFDVLGLHRLEAHIHPDNRPSMRLAERLGFVREGVLRDNYRFEDRFTDTVMFAKLSTDPR
ncbi:MAG: GNAT family N-acetyltransferase, partial [Polyangiales bacterium]